MVLITDQTREKTCLLLTTSIHWSSVVLIIDRERETETETETDRQTDRQTDRNALTFSAP